MAQGFPEMIDTLSLGNAIDGGFEWVVINFGEAPELAFLPVLRLLDAIEAPPWQPAMSTIALMLTATLLAGPGIVFLAVLFDRVAQCYGRRAQQHLEEMFAPIGCVMVNLSSAGTDYHVPFGGRGESSHGPREQGAYAVEFHTAVKTAYLAAGSEP